MTPIIFHNPNCGTSRNTLDTMKLSGEMPNIIEYLKTPPTREYLLELLTLMQLSPRDLLRHKENIYKALGLDNLTLSDPKAFLEFNDDNRMLNSPLYQRVVDVCEELVKFTWLTRGRSSYLTDRYSERVESAEELSQRVNQK